MKDSSNRSPLTRIIPMQPTRSIEARPSAFDEIMPQYTGHILSGAEMRGDLIKLFHYLATNLAQYREGTSTFLNSRMQALLYAERVATYALQDYPRQVEGEPYITTLWEGLNHVRCIVSAWRADENAGSGQTELATIETIVHNVLCEDTQSDTSGLLM